VNEPYIVTKNRDDMEAIMGRRPIGQKAMTGAQRQKKLRVKQKREATGAEKRAKREARLEVMRGRTIHEMARLGTMEHRYNVILADTPPKFENYSDLTGMDRAADNHYETMAIALIEAMAGTLPAAPDCVLYLWSTVPMLPAMMRVMAVWGFRYSSNVAWVKTTRAGDKLRLGTGFETINAHEHLLIGKRGQVPSAIRGEQFPSVIFAPRGRHSEKPGIVAETIERLYPNVPKLEMFARTHRAAWDVWGNEAPEQVRDAAE
jgi:N6-adenosine-specific RNA methylase IME4